MTLLLLSNILPPRHLISNCSRVLLKMWSILLHLFLWTLQSDVVLFVWLLMALLCKNLPACLGRSATALRYAEQSAPRIVLLLAHHTFTIRSILMTSRLSRPFGAITASRSFLHSAQQYSLSVTTTPRALQSLCSASVIAPCTSCTARTGQTSARGRWGGLILFDTGE